MRRKQISIRASADRQRGTPRKPSEEATHAETREALGEPGAEREEHEDGRGHEVDYFSTVTFAQGRDEGGAPAETERVDCQADEGGGAGDVEVPHYVADGGGVD